MNLPMVKYLLCAGGVFGLLIQAAMAQTAVKERTSHDTARRKAALEKSAPQSSDAQGNIVRNVAGQKVASDNRAVQSGRSKAHIIQSAAIQKTVTQYNTTQATTIITGKITDRSIQKVSFAYWTDPGITSAVTQDTILPTDSFYFRIPLPVGKAVFFYTDAGNGYHFYGLIRGGDSLRLWMQGDSIHFSGNGAALSRAIYAARQEQGRVVVPLNADAKQLAEVYRQQLQTGSKVLAFYRDSMPAAEWQLIRAHALGEPAANLVSTLWKLSPAPDSTLEERQVLFYKNNILPALSSFTSSDTTYMAIRYLSYLLQKAEADYFIEHRYECNNRAIYEWVKTHYSGRLRDRLLAHSLTMGFAAGNQQEEQEWCVKDYLSLVQDETCKQAIAKLYGRSRKGIGKGNVAPAFSFPDQNGKQVSLQQFSGKVVLLHFYNGADSLLPALPEIQNCFDEAGVSFVNICCNGSAVKGLLGCMLQLDEQHRDVLTQYNISKYPSYIIVGKNGKVYATRPPDPAADHGTALTNIIYEALLQ
ncbi:peroxiredoxin family protein [Chitinophaga arvensicola]|uniref:AhpC/TSA family protein n=1 Tax=Chitinophaga arvensicola TaxID=29529 RepID=A0A1I0SDP0_9BACT|nr:redoxin domain-containing protein [Chitinophaga arvensicola]SEW56179.1 AhpC/TSA family protein [Chitinophaga arvensicola]